MKGKPALPISESALMGGIYKGIHAEKGGGKAGNKRIRKKNA